MASLGPSAVIPILSICGFLAVLIVIILIYFFCCLRRHDISGKYRYYPGFTRRRTFELISIPAPGIYSSPLEVELQSSYGDQCDILVDVSYVPDEENTIGTRGNIEIKNKAQLLGTDEYYSDRFLLCTAPLVFNDPGHYIVYAHTVYPSLKLVGTVHQFCFTVTLDTQSIQNTIQQQLQCQEDEQQVSVNVYRDPGTYLPPPHTHNHVKPLPPRIIPEKGEVTTFTSIIIAPNEESTTPDQIRYSIDGSFPSLLYTGPFTLSTMLFGTDSKRKCQPVIIRAVTVSGVDGSQTSDVMEAHLLVFEAGHTFFDPNVPAPIARIRAIGAELYFDESRRPPNTNIMYQLVYIGEARQKAKFSRKKGVVYAGKPVPLSEDVAFIYAWTFVDDRSQYVNGDGLRNVRSSAAVYDCCRATTWNRGPREEAFEEGERFQQQQSLPPPSICISCNEMELFFEDPPAGGIICYTLDNTEPVQPDATTTSAYMAGIGFSGATHLPMSHENKLSLSTHIYKENQPIHVTLLKTEEVFLAARIFIPVVDPAASGAVTSYRYGERFYRGFFSQ
ncbi:hypothetical protein LSM04_009730 [Trypanosoma melophagium]|uniref:uncharacterized protein n=1 Tax=Trypanosoma melophagium TaxID=715481 RepID=UPI00351A8870|nr:hypothetical protein LSM04_009730 [Trypanosoma melophagium]